MGTGKWSGLTQGSGEARTRAVQERGQSRQGVGIEDAVLSLGGDIDTHQCSGCGESPVLALPPRSEQCALPLDVALGT
jgi:hypothetical protein